MLAQRQHHLCSLLLLLAVLLAVHAAPAAHDEVQVETTAIEFAPFTDDRRRATKKRVGIKKVVVKKAKKKTTKPASSSASVKATPTLSTARAVAPSATSVKPSTPITTSPASTPKSTSTSSSSPPTSSSSTTTTVASTTTTSSTTSSTTTTPTVYSSGIPLRTYALSQSNRGSAFFSSNYWRFWSYSDPTHGTVQYVNATTAAAAGLVAISADNTQAIVRASNADLPLGQKRPSVRFESRTAYDAALVVMDVAAMPVGCATWPALWTVAGATWPANGEIDIMEGVGYTSGNTKANLMSVHLNDTSVLSTSNGSYTGRMTSNDCMTNYGMGNTGCSFRDRNANGPSWGPAFNSAGGGVWAALWGDNMGVRIWFWGRQSGLLPAELSSPTRSAAQLNPSTWGAPVANFQSTLIDQKLSAQNIVLDITINGDWAGNVPMDGSQCGTNRTVALAAGANYNDAQFVLNGIDVYT